MTKRSRKYFERRKPLPAYRLQVFGGTGHGKSLYARFLKERYGFKAYGVDKEGAVKPLNPRHVQDTFEHWCKETIKQKA